MSTYNRNQSFGSGYSGYRNRSQHDTGHHRQKSMSTKELAMSQINPNGPPVELDEKFFSLVFGKQNISDMLTGRYPTPSMDGTSSFDNEEELLSSASDPMKCEIGIREFETEVSKLRKPVTSLKVPDTLHVTPFATMASPSIQEASRTYEEHNPTTGLLTPVTNEIWLPEDPDFDPSHKAAVNLETKLEGFDQSDFVYDLDTLVEHGMFSVQDDNDKITIEKREETVTFTSLRKSFCAERRSKLESEASKKAVDILDSSDYKSAKASFMTKFRIGKGFEKSINLQQFDSQQVEFYNKCVTFDEQQLVVPISDAAKIKFVYIPSGGGKSTLKRISKYKQHYVDVDELVANHYPEFLMIEKLSVERGDRSLMNKFFKYVIYLNVYKLYDKIVLMNHPNQIPNVYRLGFNELIILPVCPRWQLRYCSDNFISLLSVLDKVKVLSSYSSYEGIIGRYYGIHLT